MNVIIGVVNKQFRAIVSLTFHDSKGSAVTFPTVLVDTGFDGEICMPIAEIRRLGLQPASVAARVIEIADNNRVTARMYIGELQWLNEIREVLVVV